MRRARCSRPTQPQINISVNVTANPLTDTDIEVTLRLEGKAEAAGTVMFNIELEFAGVFRIQNVPQEQVQPLVLIECPRLLFPFAREIIATSVRNGGFPPLMLDPIDFVALYQQRMAQVRAAGRHGVRFRRRSTCAGLEARDELAHGPHVRQRRRRALAT